jgi:long-chain acyl-CoA synthetase
MESAEPEELIKNAKVIDKLREEIDHVSKAFKGYERVQKFSLILEDFTTTNGMLTPSLKLKRRAVLAKWGSVLDGLYA